MAEIKRLDLGNLNPITKRSLRSQMYIRRGGGGMCVGTRRGAEDVGTRKRRVASRLSETRGLCKVSAACEGDGVAEADGGLMFPAVLRRHQVKASVPGSALRYF